MKTLRLTRAALLLFVLMATAACGRTQTLVTPVRAASSTDPAALFRYDRSQPLEAEESLYEDRPEYKAYKVKYASANGERVPAFLVLPTKPNGDKAPCIVLMHGLGQDKKALAMLWGTFAKGGYAVLAIDALFHGERAPKTPVELFGTAIDSTKRLLVQTVIDLRRGIDFLESRKEIDPKRIGYVGFSMGGILGTILAGVDTRVQAPVIALAGGDWKRMAQTSTLAAAIKARQAQGADGIGWQPLDPVDPIHYAGRIAPRPVLFINGDNDTVVPVECGKELQAAAGPGKEVYIYKGGHVPAGVEFIKVLGKLTQWLDTHFKS